MFLDNMCHMFAYMHGFYGVPASHTASVFLAIAVPGAVSSAFGVIT